MSAPSAVVTIEPLVKGKLVYLPMAPNTPNGKPQARLLVELKIANTSSVPLTAAQLMITFPSGPAGGSRTINQTVMPFSSIGWNLPSGPRGDPGRGGRCHPGRHRAGTAVPARLPVRHHRTPSSHRRNRRPGDPAGRQTAPRNQTRHQLTPPLGRSSATTRYGTSTPHRSQQRPMRPPIDDGCPTSS